MIEIIYRALLLQGKVESFPGGGVVLKAFVFDLDGVLTETQKLHALAWEEMFNSFLSQRPEESPFTAEDYRRYLDGKPRQEGIQSFLSSRQIELNQEEMEELGARKNKLYLEELKKAGPHLIEDSFSFVVKLSQKKIPMAVVSSSRNSRMIMEMTGLIDFIPLIVSPAEAEAKKLQGKPHPDYFLEACRLLQVAPQDCCMVEDAISGIAAGRSGNFGKVVGIKTNNDPSAMNELKTAGADEVVTSLWNISGMSQFLQLEDARKCLMHILKQSRNYFLFLDFDGTISEIVKDPSEARPVPGVVELISELGKKIPVCIITGRDTAVIRKLIDLPHIHYAACHGFEISGPHKFHYELAEAAKMIPEFDKAQTILTGRLGEYNGIVIERKKFGLAFHYRMITSSEVREQIIKEVSDYCLDHTLFKLRTGEEVIEILPNLKWHKGKALLKLYEVLNLSKTEYPPLYFGDGKTDEDAFREMINWGIPVLVSEDERPTLARYKLDRPRDTREMLEKIKTYREKNFERLDSELR